MPANEIILPGPVSRTNISFLVVDLIKLLLYHRGQFPLPLEEARKLVNKKLAYEQRLEVPKSEVLSVRKSFVIYEDPEVKITDNTRTSHREIPCKKLNVVLSKVEKKFIDSVTHFENYFHNLQSLLESNDISEVVLNLGQNFRQPKELFHIKLPPYCKNFECSKYSLSLAKCKLYLTKAVIENRQLWNDSDPETLMPISVMIIIPSHMAIAENMEQKPFYKIPSRGKSHTFELISQCSQNHFFLKASTSEDMNKEQQHNCLNLINENFGKSSENDIELCSAQKSHLWIQLKPVLKGFRDHTTPRASDNSIWL